MKMRFCFAISIVLLTWVTPGSAEMRRPTMAEARRLLLDGNRHYKVRDFAKAIELYKEGALVEAIPVFWYNLGQSFRLDGKYKDAIWYYKRYLAESDTDDERKQVERFIDEMQKELDRTAQSTPPTGPAQDGSSPEPASQSPPRAAETVASAPPLAVPRPKSETSSPSSTMTYVGYGVGGAGIGLLGVGVVLGLHARSQWDDAKANCRGASGVLSCTPTGLSLHDDASRSATLSTIAVASGLVAIGAGITMLLVSPSEPRTEPVKGVQVVPVIGQTGVSVNIQGGF